MSTIEAIRFVGEMQSLALKPDDILVLSTDDNLTDDIAERLRARLESRFPGRTCIVLSCGMRLGVLSPEAA